MRMIVFLAATLAVIIPCVTAAQPVVASRLDCEPGEMVVCTTRTADGGIKVLVSRRARVLQVCPATERGVSLECVSETDVRAAEQGACRELGWQWVNGQCVRPRPPRERGSEGSSCPDCPDCICPNILPPPDGGRCTESELSRISDELNRINRNREVVANTGPLQEQAAELYGLAVRCGDRDLANRAADLIRVLEPAPLEIPDYREGLDQLSREHVEGFQAVHNHLDGIDRSFQEAREDENWCLDTVPGVLTCVVLPALAISAGVTLGVLAVYDYFDDDSPEVVVSY